MGTPITAPTSGDFVRILAPDGLHNAVCVDVLDRGPKQTEYGMKHKVSVHWFLDALIPVGDWTHPKTGLSTPVPEAIAGKPFSIQAWFNKTMHENGSLRQMLEGWRGEVYTHAELDSFDLDSVIGVPAYVNIQYNASGDEWYANVQSVMRIPEGVEAMTVPGDYVKLRDRPPREDQEAAVGGHEEPWPDPETSGPANDGDLPF